MNEKLLTLYNHILVALLFGDAIVGVAWLFRYNYITNNLKSDLKYKLNNDYGYDPSFQVRHQHYSVSSVFLPLPSLVSIKIMDTVANFASHFVLFFYRLDHYYYKFPLIAKIITMIGQYKIGK